MDPFELLNSTLQFSWESGPCTSNTSGLASRAVARRTAAKAGAICICLERAWLFPSQEVLYLLGSTVVWLWAFGGVCSFFLHSDPNRRTAGKD